MSTCTVHCTVYIQYVDVLKQDNIKVTLLLLDVFQTGLKLYVNGYLNSYQKGFSWNKFIIFQKYMWTKFMHIYENKMRYFACISNLNERTPRCNS